MNEWTLVLAACGTALVLVAVRRRLLLSLAKERSLAGHPRLARMLARFVPSVSYDEHAVLGCDGAPSSVVAGRHDAMLRLGSLFADRFRRSNDLTRATAASLSDLRFTSTYRVPPPFSAYARERLPGGTFVESTSGVLIVDADGNESFDLSGSYGVNLFGNDFYKDCIAKGSELVHRLGPVLGPLHPIVAENAEKLRAISGQDEVSFHMSGTEAVMQAVRLARYHTGRRRVCCFAGAYHGWWDDVQPGVGNPIPARNTIVLREMDERALEVLRTRNDVACVLINPLQALHPNRSAPSDAALIGARDLSPVDRSAYAAWLQALREVCTAKAIPLIFDEVFVGFRIARGGAQEYFGVPADMVTYGKTLGGGLPVGALCGKARFMRRFKDDRPADVCLARGTFNSHPYVMGTMNRFLTHVDLPETAQCYASLDATWTGRVRRFNEALAAAEVPVAVTGLSTIWAVAHKAPSRFNWMLQYYLRAHGLALSWVGSGRLIFSLAYTESDMADVTDRFVAACTQMRDDGWHWHPPTQTNRTIRRQLAREMLAAKLSPSRGTAPILRHVTPHL